MKTYDIPYFGGIDIHNSQLFCILPLNFGQIARWGRNLFLLEDMVEQAYGYAFILAAHAAARTAGVAW